MRSSLGALLTAAGMMLLGGDPWPAEAASTEFPLRGTFGDPTRGGCQSARAQEEGVYVELKAHGAVAAGGETNCAYARVARASPSKYVLTGVCSESEAKPQPKKLTLIVIGRDEIEYDGLRLVRCK